MSLALGTVEDFSFVVDPGHSLGVVFPRCLCSRLEDCINVQKQQYKVPSRRRNTLRSVDKGSIYALRIQREVPHCVLMEDTELLLG